MSEQRKHPLLSNGTYDLLKFLVTIFLPGVGAFYFAVAQIWGFPNSHGVNGTINALAILLGLLLNYSTRTYNAAEIDGRYDGSVFVAEDEEDGTKYLTLGIPQGQTVDTVASKSEIRLRVENVK